MITRKGLLIGFAFGFASGAFVAKVNIAPTAHAQLPPSYISGTGAITPGHCASWTNGTTIQDSGASC